MRSTSFSARTFSFHIDAGGRQALLGFLALGIGLGAGSVFETPKALFAGLVFGAVVAHFLMAWAAPAERRPAPARSAR